MLYRSGEPQATGAPFPGHSQAPTSPNPKLIPCRDCYVPISKNAEVCPRCGTRIKLSRTDVVATIWFVLFIIGMLLAMAVAVAR